MENNLINQKFNRFTVISYIKKYSRTYLVCKCECGNIKDIKMSHLKSGRIKSCGCWRIEELKSRKGRVSKLLKPNNYSAKYRLYKKYEKAAFNRNYDFKLDLDYFIYLTELNCYYCDIEPNKIIKARVSRSAHIYNGVDRKDNNIGYSKKNCVPCCRQCNISKNSLSKKEFLSWISRVDNFNKVDKK